MAGHVKRNDPGSTQWLAFLHGVDGHLNFQRWFAAAVDHAAQRRHIGEVAAAERDVLQRRQNIIGRVEVDPADGRNE